MYMVSYFIQTKHQDSTVNSFQTYVFYFMKNMYGVINLSSNIYQQTTGRNEYNRFIVIYENKYPYF